MPSDIDVYLEDAVYNTFTLLNDGEYAFTADEDLSETGRFYLRFEGNALTVTELPINKLIIYSEFSTNSIVIEGDLEEETSFVLYELNGKNSMKDQLDIFKNRQVIAVDRLSAGVYIIELMSQSGSRRFEKLIIK